MDGWWLEAVGWIGSAVLVWSLLQTELHRLRIINLVGCLVLIVYNGVVGVWHPDAGSGAGGGVTWAPLGGIQSM